MRFKQFFILTTIFYQLVIVGEANTQNTLLMKNETIENLYNASTVAINRSDYKTAMKLFERMLVLSKESGNKKWISVSHIGIGEMYDQLGDYRKALDNKNKALLIVKDLDDANAKVLSGINISIGTTYTYLGIYELALNYFDDALETIKKLDKKGIDNKKLYVKAINNIIVFYTRFGEYKKAKEYLSKVISHAIEIGDSYELLNVLTNAGNLFRRLAEFDRSISYYKKAFDVSTMIYDKKGQAQSQTNIATIYMDLGDNERALMHSKKALELHKSIDNVRGMAITYNNMGLIYLDSGILHKAMYCLDRSYNIHYEIGDRIGLNRSLSAIGDVYLQENDFTDAIRVYKLARDSLGIGNLFNKLGQYEKALECFNNFYYRYHEEALQSFETMMIVYFGLGEAQEGLVQHEKAALNYIKAIELIEKIRSSIKAEKSKRGFLSSHFAAYENICKFLYNLSIYDHSISDLLKQYGNNTAEIAFLFTEKAKARSLVEMLAQVRTEKVAHLLPKPLAEKEAQLTAYLGNLESQIDKAFEKGKEAQQLLERNIKETRSELEVLIAQIKKDYPDYAALRYPEAVTVGKIPLLESERLLEYQVTEDATYLFVVQKEKVNKFMKINISRKELKNKIRNFRVSFEDEKFDQFNPHEARELYTLLVAAGLESVAKNQHLIIVPDGPLHLLPFEALVVDAENVTKTIDPETGIPTYKGVTYLADQWEVSYYQSATVLTINRTAVPKKAVWEKPLFAVADPVFNEDDPRWPESLGSQVPLLASTDFETEGVIFPIRSAAEESGYAFHRLKETRYEVLTIGKLYGLDEIGPDIKLGLGANERDIKQMDLAPYQNIIFSTHGILGNEVPYLQQPALVLSQVDTVEEDGFLTMEEVLGLRLNADLVTLSACKTGLGEQVKGEGVVGLSRSFMYAGTKSVLVSLWSVSSNSTEALMKAFYTYMKQGKSKAEALRLAKRDIRKGTFELSVGRGLEVTERKIKVSGSHPFFWAPFVLIGEWQ